MTESDTSKILHLFRSELIVVNVGPRSFADVLDKKLQELLEYLGGY